MFVNIVYTNLASLFCTMGVHTKDSAIKKKEKTFLAHPIANKSVIVISLIETLHC